MVVTLPVPADGSVDVRGATVQPHLCSAAVRLPILLNVVLLGCKSNHRNPSFDAHPPDIPTLQLLGVLEVGIAALGAPRLPVHDLATAIVRPPGGVQGRHAKLLSFAPISNSNQLSPQNRSMHKTQEALDDVSVTF